ncbi:MAG: dihydrolipoyl dehydrogenase [Sandaracinaceae bacterium]
MEKRRADVAIIGAGTAGLNARREVERAGKSWVLIEEGPYGTTCARVGCMPSKLLIAAAEAAHHVHGARRFGVHVRGEVDVNGREVMDRVRSERDRFVGFVVRATEALPAEARLHGTARFVGPTTLVVDDHTQVEAGAVVVATGSAPWVPPPFDQLEEHVVVNDDVFEWEDLPGSVAVVGTGIIGLELGQALHRLGVKVTFFNPFEELGPFTDPVIQAKVRAVLDEELDLQVGIADVEAEARGDGVEVHWTRPDGERRRGRFAKVLAAAGRRPNVGRLDLAQAGIELDGRGRPRGWDRLTAQVGDLPVFLAGDVNEHLPLLHEASDEGRIAGSNAAAWPGPVSAHVRRTPLVVAFTDPQMAMVGERFADLNPDDIEVGEVSYDDQGRARVMGVNRGLARFYGSRVGCRLVGAEMFGPRMEHMAHTIAWAIQQGLQVQQVLELPFYHPVFEEGLRTGLRDLGTRLRVTGTCSPESRSDAPGA